MRNKDIIREIIKRFKLDASSIKKMKDYEYDLIYETLTNIKPETITKAINSFKKNEFKIKTIKTSFHKN